MLLRMWRSCDTCLQDGKKRKLYHVAMEETAEEWRFRTYCRECQGEGLSVYRKSAQKPLQVEIWEADHAV